MSETKEQKKFRLRKTVLIRHRRNKNLCIRCGLDGKHGDFCTEDYTQTDMRGLPQEPVSVDLKKKKDTVLSYRRKKNLCINCGREQHENDCDEDLEHSDNRTEEEKIERPAKIPTPKPKGPTIIEEMETKRDIDVFMEPRVKINLHREFVVLDLSKSDSGNMVDFSCICQLSKKLNPYIICIAGDIDKYFPFSDVIKIRKLTNIREIKPLHEQVIVDHIGSCKKLFTFPNILYTPICIKYDIPIFEFEDGKNATNFLPDEAYKI